MADDEIVLRKGEVMVIKGLKSSPELNGSHVEVMSNAPRDEQSRVAVRALDAGARKLLVRCVNLTPRRPYERARPFEKLAPSLAPFAYVPSADGVETNLLVLLHGLGDSAANFVEFASRLALPQTSLLAVTAPGRLPFDMGAAWYPAFEQDGSLIAEPVPPDDRRRAEGLRASRLAVQTLLRGLINRCNWRGSELFLLGFSQGGLVALDVATHTATPPLGGSVGLSCMCLLPEQDALRDGRAEQSALRSPLISMHGALDETVPLSLARETRDALRTRLAARQAAQGAGLAGAEPLEGADQHEYVELPGAKHATPQSAEHARPLLAFFSRHLVRRSPALEEAADVIELAPGVASLSRAA